MSYTPNGLATVALLKTRLDEGRDHLGLFEPLVEDALTAVAALEFGADEIRALLLERTGIVIPLETVKTLLRRFIRRGGLKARGERYFLQSRPQVDGSLAKARAEAQAHQQVLGEAFFRYAAEAGLALENTDAALRVLSTLASENKVPLILKEPLPDSPLERSSLSRKVTRVAARFITHNCLDSPSLRPALQSLVEGILLHDALFLGDTTNASQRFQNLTVAVDTKILFAAIDLAGGPNATAAREGLSLLRQAGARTIAFENTVDEMRRVLAFYENRLATPSGIATLWPTDLRNHILNVRYSPSDIRIISASLEGRLQVCGVAIVPLAEHQARFTLDEKLLSEMLAGEGRDHSDSWRVRHDVDAIAAVLTLRRGRISSSVERSIAVFCSTTGKVIHNTQRWYATQDQGGIPPVIHLSALTSIAWLKKPAAAPGIKVHELVALCASAMRPTSKTWEKMTETLRRLRDEGAISDDETAAIVASELTEPFLAQADEDGEPDEASIRGVIERVRGAYRREASADAEQVVQSARADMAAAQQASQDAVRAAQAEAPLAREEAAAAVANRDVALNVLGMRIHRTGRMCANVVFVLGSAVTVAAVFISILGVAESLRPEWRWAAVGVLIAAGVLTVASRVFGGSLLAWRDRLAAYINTRCRLRYLGEPGIPDEWCEGKECVSDGARLSDGRSDSVASAGRQ